MHTLDTIDRRLLAELQRDADLPFEELGQRAGLSRNAVWRRVKAMEAAGIIRGKVTLVDPGAVGLGLMVFMLIRTDRHAPDWLDRFRKATRDMPEILAAYRMTGDLDYLVQARVADVAAYDALYQALIKRIEIADVSASFVMEQLKETTALPV